MSLDTKLFLAIIYLECGHFLLKISEIFAAATSALSPLLPSSMKLSLNKYRLFIYFLSAKEIS